MRPKVELLAPAGDMECLRFALHYGADAVYLGAKEFGMRSSSQNFTDAQLYEAAELAHARGRRVYLTLNTLPTNEEMDRLPRLLYTARQASLDAVIVADLGVLHMIRRHTPHMEVHFSTQAGVANWAAACAAYEMGVRRVVLARELSLEDIAAIREKTPPQLELEVFVHGAMCMSVSGRCLLSQHLTGRDANRGRCTQSCRWKYTLHEEQRPGQQFEIGEGEGGSYILSADDLCAAPLLDKVVQAGATGLKIEGRSKSFYYVASTTAAYRAALDAALAAPPGIYECPAFAMEELRRTSHRPYSTGFFLGREGATQSPERGNYIREWQIVGVVDGQRDGRVYCTQRGKFRLGEELEALLPAGRCVRFTPADIRDAEGNPIQATPHTKMAFSVPAIAGETLPPMSILRRSTGATENG